MFVKPDEDAFQLHHAGPQGSQPSSSISRESRRVLKTARRRPPRRVQEVEVLLCAFSYDEAGHTRGGIPTVRAGRMSPDSWNLGGLRGAKRTSRWSRYEWTSEEWIRGEPITRHPDTHLSRFRNTGASLGEGFRCVSTRISSTGLDGQLGQRSSSQSRSAPETPPDWCRHSLS